MFPLKNRFSSAGRALAIAAVAATALTAIEPAAFAATKAPVQAASSAAAAGNTDFSAQRRPHGGGGAAAAAFAGIVGTGIAIAATQNRRDYYESSADGGPYESYGHAPGYDGGYGYGGHRRGVPPGQDGHPLASW